MKQYTRLILALVVLIGIAGTFPKEELEETDADLIIAEIKYLTKDAITKVG